jgi:hypothetical protein
MNLAPHRNHENQTESMTYKIAHKKYHSRESEMPDEARRPPAQAPGQRMWLSIAQ